MAAHMSAFIDLESSSSPTSELPAALPSVAKAPNHITISNVELDEMTFGTRYNGPGSSSSNNKSGDQSTTAPTTPYTGAQTPQPLLLDEPPSYGVASYLPSWSNPPMNKWRILSGCLVFFGNALVDASVGALIPYIQEYYNIGYATVSMIFVTQAIGFISAAFFNDFFLTRLGRAKTIVLSEALLILGCVMIVTTPPFPVVAISYFFLGFAEAVNLAVINLFCANLAQSTIILGIVHGSYGLGGIIGPIAATALVSHGVLWSRDYFIPLGLRILCVTCAGLAFRGYEQEEPTKLQMALEQTAQQRLANGEGEAAPTKLQLLLKALGTKTTLFGAIFIFAYQGSEVSISGWVISYLINYRGGDPSKVGYVTAGFWGGITLGRFFLAPLARKTGERIFVAILALGAVGLQLLVWLVPSLIADSISVSFVGLLLGPVYPCATTVFARLLPRQIQTTSISFIASAGSSGGAVAPFLTGLLAQAVGTYVLHPVCIALFALMLGVWFLLPKTEKRRE